MLRETLLEISVLNVQNILIYKLITQPPYCLATNELIYAINFQLKLLFFI